MSIITDNFNRANQNPLGSSSEGWSWAVLVDTVFQIVSNAANGGTTAESVARAESDLSSSNHYVQATIGGAPLNWGLLARFSSSVVDTYYLAQATSATTLDLYSRVAGTFNLIGTAGSLTIIATDIIKLQCNGTTISVFQNGVSRISVTDSAIAGNTRTGMRAGDNAQVYDDFSAADLAGSGGVIQITLAMG